MARLAGARPPHRVALIRDLASAQIRDPPSAQIRGPPSALPPSQAEGRERSAGASGLNPPAS